ncbi:MAG: hypothetical protein JST90_03265 [Bacteroidetes bacterium]|nr:hypothetical protein [Bacteroidota bacterium]
MKTIFTSIVILALAVADGPKYSFVKKGFYSERNKYCHCIAEGNYAGKIAIDSIFHIDPATLHQYVTVAYRNIKTGEWRYYDTTHTTLIGIVIYTPDADPVRKGLADDTINEYAYDSLYYYDLDIAGQ